MSASPKPPNARNAEALVKSAKVLIVDDDYYTRKVVRTLLLLVGVTDIHDAGDGPSGLEAIRDLAPDVVILDWEMPGMSGAQFARAVTPPFAMASRTVPTVVAQISSGSCSTRPGPG